MNKKVLLLIIFFLIIVAFVGYKFIFSRISSVGGLKIVSTPSTNIFLNDKLLGKTPYEDKHPAGEYVLKLIPESSATEASAWQGKIKLNPSVLTYVNRELGISELKSGGEILTLEKNSQTEAQVAIFSQPDAATVLLDGQEKGTAPLSFTISAGEHDLAITSPGFVSRTVRIQSTGGYKLIVNFQLALASNFEVPSSEATSSAGSISEKPTTKPSVLIKDTPTGFLRVRTSPNTSATEVAQVKPGDKYLYLEEKEGWYKITYTEGKEGWISSRYAEKID